MSSLPKIFISYTRSDQAFVKRLADDLKALNLGVWVDFWEIKIGDSLIQKIDQGLSEADYVVAVLSKQSVRAPWVNHELRQAFHRAMSADQRLILPIKLDDCKLPGFLSDLVYADFGMYEAGLEQLLRSLYPEALLQRRASDIVQNARQLGHLLPECFLDNAYSAISRYLVPLAEANYGTLFWGGMEWWFDQNIESGVTSLTKWEQLSFFIQFSSNRFELPEEGEYSIPWRFVPTKWKEQFDWDKLSFSDPGVRRRSLFGQGPHQIDVRLAHHAVMDFAIALKLSIQLGILREELSSRIPVNTIEELTCSDKALITWKRLGPSPLKFILELSRINLEHGADLLRRSEEGYLSDRYGNANLVALLKTVTGNQLSQRDFSGLDLSNADFSSCNLTKANFRSSRLVGANFAASILEQADWRDTEISQIIGILPARYRSICFSEGDRHLFAGDGDGIVRCFDVQTGFAHVSPLGHHEVVSALALNEDGDSILSASHDGTIRTARVNDTMDVRNSTMVFDWNTVTWDKVKLWWVVPHDYCVGQEAVIDMTNHFFRKKHSKSLMCMAFSRRLKTIAFGTYNGVLGILNLDEETLEFANMADANNYGKGHWDTIWQVRFSNTSALLASSGGAGDPGIKLWDLQRRDLLSVFHVGECRDFVFSGDDRWLINADDKGKICKWEVGGDGRQPTQQIELKADSKILALEIDYEQKLFATGDNKGYVRLWNAETLEEEACVNVHQSEIWALRFSYHGGHLATAGNDGSIALINVRRGTPTFGVCNRVFMDKGACAGMLASGLRGKDHGFVEKVAVMLREYGAKI